MERARLHTFSVHKVLETLLYTQILSYITILASKIGVRPAVFDKSRLDIFNWTEVVSPNRNPDLGYGNKSRLTAACQLWLLLRSALAA